MALHSPATCLAHPGFADEEATAAVSTSFNLNLVWIEILSHVPQANVLQFIY
ncbi:hypothetical protein K443DRAFT_477108 [Laccaria amethystina LaAM-08-1]|uniref:Uncharacterized protein n=1 Tax=Laccaria amethystina LaAM-08-1 TaxID=1095629 RepID=A0A0C9XEZ6_9AGAR|nr:hypothetical protein K443DRAFT_477108 [Laccaria amethystina LaAM-08-1]